MSAFARWARRVACAFVGHKPRVQKWHPRWVKNQRTGVEVYIPFECGRCRRDYAIAMGPDTDLRHNPIYSTAEDT